MNQSKILVRHKRKILGLLMFSLFTLSLAVMLGFDVAWAVGAETPAARTSATLEFRIATENGATFSADVQAFIESTDRDAKIGVYVKNLFDKPVDL